MPLTPNKIWQAIQQAKAGSDVASQAKAQIAGT